MLVRNLGTWGALQATFFWSKMPGFWGKVLERYQDHICIIQQLGRLAHRPTPQLFPPDQNPDDNA
jgi:hypothetical protein